MITIYKWIAILAIVATTIGSIFYLKHRVTVLEADVSAKEINIKSMERGMLIFVDKNKVLHTQTVQMQSSIAELEYSKDSVTHALLDSIKRWKIVQRSVTEVGQIQQKLDQTTVIHYAPGSYAQKDTTYDFSVLPFIINTVSFTHDSAVNHLEVNDSIALIFHDHKETIAPPKKFFLFRWFQRKQLVNEVDVVHSNKLIKTTQQKFVHINK